MNQRVIRVVTGDTFESIVNKTCHFCSDAAVIDVSVSNRVLPNSDAIVNSIQVCRRHAIIFNNILNGKINIDTFTPEKENLKLLAQTQIINLRDF